MSPAGFLSLLAATVTALVATAIALAIQPDFSARAVVSGGPMMPALAERVEDVQRLEVDYPGYSLRLEKRDGGWVAPDLGEYPAKPDSVADLLASLAGMTRVEPKTDNPDWYEYIRVGGPDVPSNVRGIRIRALAGSGEVLADAVLGRASASIGYTQLGGTFVRPFDQQQAWLVEGSARVPSALGDWFEQLFSLPGPELAKIAFLDGGEAILAAEKSESGKYELMTISPELGPPGSTINDEMIRNLSQVVVSVNFENVRPRASFAGQSGSRTVRFMTQNGMELDATLLEVDDQTWVTFDVASGEDPQASEEAAAIASRVEHWAFLLPERRIELLQTPVSELIAPPDAAPTPRGEPAFPPLPQ